MKKVYTHDEAARIVEAFEDVLIKNNIRVPSPEDDEREEYDCGLYGTVFADLMDYVEDILVDLCRINPSDAEIIVGEYSGEF